MTAIVGAGGGPIDPRNTRSIDCRCHQASAASAASTKTSAIHPAQDRRGAMISAMLGGSIVALRTSRIAATARSSAASVAAAS